MVNCRVFVKRHLTLPSFAMISGPPTAETIDEDFKSFFITLFSKKFPAIIIDISKVAYLITSRVYGVLLAEIFALTIRGVPRENAVLVSQRTFRPNQGVYDSWFRLDA